MGIQKKTQIKYWAIFEDYLKRLSVYEIQSIHEVCRATVFKAVKYCREYKLDLGKPEQLDIAIAAKQKRINYMYERIDFYREGWEASSIKRDANGNVTYHQVKKKFSPSAETAFMREIRELERDIEELQGLRDFIRHRDGIEDTSEELDEKAIRDALVASENHEEE